MDTRSPMPPFTADPPWHATEHGFVKEAERIWYNRPAPLVSSDVPLRRGWFWRWVAGGLVLACAAVAMVVW